MQNNWFNTITASGAILITMALTAFAQSTWSEPLMPPPVCNQDNPGCDRPIHTGPGTQIKRGNLQVNSFLSATNILSATQAIAENNQVSILVGGDPANPGIKLVNQIPGGGASIQFDTQSNNLGPETVLSADVRPDADNGILHPIMRITDDVAPQNIQIGIGVSDPQDMIHIGNPTVVSTRRNEIIIPSEAFRANLGAGRKPPSADCDEPSEAGRMIMDRDAVLWVCLDESPGGPGPNIFGPHWEYLQAS
ncbi:MAG: hypothetical protein COU08_04240 [Candidatus Harrisonbacteria bacterium CG10_big_fil_rev_8_21_14_0_10_42_17]|uniref:Secreted protein n=1 Tax=Candidatus Harrisonbacteria bacterium CG10_big_fil_rev_8_21_14_0_10_42_17 TaxID=1974584 RepID=A0A2M6WGX8_9BACT|nr:MAG: hypothetical protein COU08_04240 [Candidatus Harrisonbacteria bacterium CG10_big_fil_rev_8_21_14_0_10_42_17]